MIKRLFDKLLNFLACLGWLGFSVLGIWCGVWAADKLVKYVVAVIYKLMNIKALW